MTSLLFRKIWLQHEKKAPHSGRFRSLSTEHLPFSQYIKVHLGAFPDLWGSKQSRFAPHKPLAMRPPCRMRPAK